MAEDLISFTNRAPMLQRASASPMHGLVFTDAPESKASAHFDNFVTPFNGMVVSGDSRIAYVNQYSNPYSSEHWVFAMDHCYARPWKAESTFLRPTKTIFMPKADVSDKRPGPAMSEEIDVEGGVAEVTPVYDRAKALTLMQECEKHAALARVDDGNTDWEDSISKVNWTPTQHRLFKGMVSILNSERLARLSYENTDHEPIARRATIDKSVVRIRKLLATCSWDPKFTQWLHQLLIENLSTSYLSAYLDILQTLKSKVPAFVEKMMHSGTSSRLSVLSHESLFPLMKKPWDPVGLSLMHDKPKKLPGNPILVVVPSTPISSKRMMKWITLLSTLSTVVTIPSNYGPAGQKMTMSNYVDQMFVMTKSKIQDIRADYPGRNIVLIGFNFGTTLALQVAQVEQVLCVICLGFSLITADGRRGDPEDNLLELQCPVLFVIGQCSTTALQEEIEDLRERMRVETGLVVVGSADSSLRVKKRKKVEEGVTQSIVDRCVADEVGEFISGVILSPYPPQIRQSPTNLTTDGASVRKGKAERKRYSSNTSSLDSEPPSPIQRITRPVGRPPGSIKSKAKLEAKWASQGIPPSPSTTPPPANTPDSSSNDSSLADKLAQNIDAPTPTKKIKTLRPTTSTPTAISSAAPPPEKHVTNPPSTQASPTTSPTKHQPGSAAKNLSFQNRSLSNLLQTDIQTLVQPPPPKSAASGIRVLENVKISSGHKYLPSPGRPLDVAKISVINPMKTGPGSSIMVLPDGKIKAVTGPKGTYITSKRQLLGNKPPKPVKKIYMPQAPTMASGGLPPPANLTTQDIMDLPIIFADDNQMLDNHPPPRSSMQHDFKSAPQVIASGPPPPHSKMMTGTPNSNKFLLINKQITLQNHSSPNYVISHANVKRMSHPMHTVKSPRPKTKIILSARKLEETQAANANIITKITSLSPEISVKKVVAATPTLVAPPKPAVVPEPAVVPQAPVMSQKTPVPMEQEAPSVPMTAVQQGSSENPTVSEPSEAPVQETPHVEPERHVASPVTTPEIKVATPAEPVVATITPAVSPPVPVVAPVVTTVTVVIPIATTVTAAVTTVIPVTSATSVAPVATTKPAVPTAPTPKPVAPPAPTTIAPPAAVAAKSLPPMELLDLENEIAASTVYKPSSSSPDVKNITIVTTTKTGESTSSTVPIRRDNPEIVVDCDSYEEVCITEACITETEEVFASSAKRPSTKMDESEGPADDRPAKVPKMDAE